MTTEEQGTTAPKWVCEVVMDLSLEEITNLKRLADLEEKTVGDCARDCMNAHCKAILDAYDEASTTCEPPDCRRHVKTEEPLEKEDAILF
jgi:hypothetical protein